IADRVYDCVIETEAAVHANPGQLIGIYPKDKSPLLFRPMLVELSAKKGVLFNKISHSFSSTSSMWIPA
ncbi:MAG: hypothetical protein IJX66_02755, partial [Lachnospiraceae bacterium]|nr:hypothetical protein [Lachnospiraceae bacterium]